jgi:hypothetical protein
VQQIDFDQLRDSTQYAHGSFIERIDLLRVDATRRREHVTLEK